ncbi:MAG: DUF4382 domain-containing protein [Bacteroidota bacterium]
MQKSKLKRQSNTLLGVMLIAFTTMLFAVTSCEEEGTAGMLQEKGEGQLNVQLTDAPISLDLIEEANVTISKIEIRKDLEGQESDTANPFMTLYDSTETYNLMELRNGVTETLVDMEVPVGEYDLIRMYVDSAGLTLTNGDSYDVKVPSGEQTGIKIFIDPAIQVASGLTSNLLLDFDLSKSFILKGNMNSPAGVKGFNFKPVIRAVNQTTAGQISGAVTDTSESIVEDAAVWIEQDTVVTTTYSDSTGGYSILGVEEGIYDLYAVKDGYDTTMVQDVEVVAGNETTRDIELIPEEDETSEEE